MPFFARPDLSNEQFKQLGDSVLTLSGQTQIANVTGLTVMDEAEVFIPIIVTGATDGKVLTYDSTLSQIILKPSSSVGAFIYSGASPSTCTVGGLSAGTTVYGEQIVDILQQIIAPTVSPSIVEPSSTFSVLPLTRIYEVGCILSFTGYSTFNPGTISPVYCSGPSVRSCGLNYYTYSYRCCGLLTGATSPQTFQSFSIELGSASNTITGNACYQCGDFPRNSDGTCLPKLSAGTTTTITCAISGIYPYYYGKITCACPAGVGRPTATCIKSVITGGTGGTGGTCTKCVCASTGTLSVRFCSNADDYLWFAIPVASTAKTKWYVDALNNGSIGGAVSAGGNLFPAYDSVTNVKSNIGCWSGQTYQIYVSNYQTSTKCCGGTCCYIMELRNS